MYIQFFIKSQPFITNLVFKRVITRQNKTKTKTKTKTNKTNKQFMIEVKVGCEIILSCFHIDHKDLTCDSMLQMDLYQGCAALKTNLSFRLNDENVFYRQYWFNLSFDYLLNRID